MSPSRPYRLLLTTWQDFGAGSVRSVENLARGLHAAGHDVLVACPAEGVLGRRLEAAGIPMVDFVFRQGWSLHSARELARLVRAHGIELIDAQESRDRKAAILARWLFGCRAALVITRRQMSSTFPLENAIYSAASDAIITVSRGVARSLKGARRERVVVVHDGLSPRQVAGDVAPERLDALRCELELDASLPVIGVVARRKDQETLLSALPLLGRAVNVVFVGIERDAALAALEPALPAGCRVAYTGFRDDVLPLWRLLDISVLTTRGEGLPHAIMEAMGQGIPVIAAAVGGTPEIVRDGENGLLYDVGDAASLAECLARVLDDPELRARLTAAGRETVAGPFHVDAMVRRTEAVYAALLEPAGSGGVA